jgi:hypothetical protein
MATTLKTKNSVTAASAPSSLAQGELAVNITDKKLWVGNAATTPVQLLGTGSSAAFGAVTCTSLTDSGLTTGRVTYATTGGLLTDSTNMTFDGADLTLGGNLLSSVNAGKNLGSTSNRWANIYVGAVSDGASSTASLLDSASTTVRHAVGSGWAAQAFYTGATERMRIDSAGNVGIGTSSPSYLLNVSKNGSGGDAAQFVRITDTNTSNSVGPLHLTIGAANHFAANPSMVLAGTNGIALAVGDGSDLATQRALTITSAGNVGIGTSSPSQNLVISSSSAGQTLVNIINTSSNYSWNIGVVGSSAGLAGAGSLVIRDSTNGENVITTAGVNRTIALQGATSTTGVGITFPATQNASSDANTLDDYEEGTFTTTLTNCGSGVATLGTYVKIGNTITARLTITGGTYTANSSRFNLPFVSVQLQSGTFTVGTLRGGFIEAQSGSTQCYFATTDSGTAYPTITYITS